MTVYNQISENKVKTFLIMFFFILIFSSFFFLLGKYFDSPWGYFFLGFFISLASSVGSYFYGDKLVLLTTGAQPASKKQFFNFYTVTENLTLAAGLPMPNLYVINDHSPNAFATGRSPDHSAVCATTGLLETMDDQELEGVMAHELGHVKNYDMRVNTIAFALAGIISMIGDFFWHISFFGGNNRREGNQLMYALAIVAVILAPIAAMLIQLAISRRREYLADATGALTTRYPDGLASALEKIGKYGSALKKPNTATAHMFFANPLSGKGFASLFSTHPPITERIKRLQEMRVL